MKRKGKKLSELASILTPFPQVLLNVPVGHKKDPHQIPEVSSLVKKVQKKLGEKGRILVRPSGTESLIRVMVEGEKAKEIRGYAEEIARCVRKNMAE